MNETQIAQAALDQLQENTGLTGAWKATHDTTAIDGRLEFRLTNGNEAFYVEVKKQLRNHNLPGIMDQAKLHQPLMVIAVEIFPKLKEALRKENIAYLDLAGNIYLHTPKHYIWIEGNKNAQITDKERNRAFNKTGLKVILHLLENKNAINYQYRRIAEEAGVALGNITTIVEGLREANFILQVNNREMKLQNKKELLNRWITGYEEILKPANFIGAFRFRHEENIENWHTLPLTPGHTAWGGEPAGEFLTTYLNPAQLTVYTNERNKLMRDWILIPQETTGNAHVIMYDKFWKTDEPGHNNIAPFTVVYADLLMTGDPRCIETAEMIYDKFLKQEYDE